MFTTLAVAIRILANPLSNVFQKRLTAERVHPLVVNFVVYFLLAILSLLFSFGIAWKSFPVEFWIYSAVVGFLGAIGNGFLVRAIHYGELSVLGPINAYKSVVSVVAGIFLLGEIPGIRGCIGIALIILGSYYVLDTTPERFSWRLFRRRDLRYRFGAMIFAATEAVFIKKVILLSSPGVSFVTWCWFGALFSGIFLYPIRSFSWPEQIRCAPPQFSRFLKLTLCVGMMQLTTNYVFDVMYVGYALSLFQLSAIVSILLGSRFFNEKDILRKSIGAGIMIAGSIVIILFTR